MAAAISNEEIRLACLEQAVEVLAAQLNANTRTEVDIGKVVATAKVFEHFVKANPV